MTPSFSKTIFTSMLVCCCLGIGLVRVEAQSLTYSVTDTLAGKIISMPSTDLTKAQIVFKPTNYYGSAKFSVTNDKSFIYESFKGCDRFEKIGSRWGCSVYTDITVGGTAIKDASWFNASWSQRMAGNVSSTYDLTNYQLRLEFAVPTNASANCWDFAFSDATDSKALPFWVESCQGGNAVVWLEGNWTATTGTQFYLYFANATQLAGVSQSSTSAMLDYSTGASADGWGCITLSGAGCTSPTSSGGSIVYAGVAGESLANHTWNSDGFPIYGFRIQGYSQYDNGFSGGGIIWNMNNGTTNGYIGKYLNRDYGYGYLWIEKIYQGEWAGNGTGDAEVDGAWYKFDAKVNATNFTVEYSTTGSDIITHRSDAQFPITTTFGYYYTGTGKTLRLRNVSVARYVTPEPITAFGSIEFPSGGGGSNTTNTTNATSIFGSHDYCIDSSTLIKTRIVFNGTKMTNTTEYVYCDFGCGTTMCNPDPFYLRLAVLLGIIVAAAVVLKIRRRI